MHISPMTTVSGSCVSVAFAQFIVRAFFDEVNYYCDNADTVENLFIERIQFELRESGADTIASTLNDE